MFSKKDEFVSIARFLNTKDVLSLTEVCSGLYTTKKFLLPSDTDACLMHRVVKGICTYYSSIATNEVTHVRFDDDYDDLDALNNLSNDITHIHLGRDFNQNIKRLPPKLDTLIFSDRFNKRLRRGVLPMNLRTVVFGADYNLYTASLIFPPHIKYIEYGDNFNRCVNTGIPNSLKKIVLGKRFNRSLNVAMIPSSLKELVIHSDYSRPIGVNLFLTLDLLVVNDRVIFERARPHPQ